MTSQIPEDAVPADARDLIVISCALHTFAQTAHMQGLVRTANESVRIANDIRDAVKAALDAADSTGKPHQTAIGFDPTDMLVIGAALTDYIGLTELAGLMDESRHALELMQRIVATFQTSTPPADSNAEEIARAAMEKAGFKWVN